MELLDKLAHVFKLCVSYWANEMQRYNQYSVNTSGLSHIVFVILRTVTEA